MSTPTRSQLHHANWGVVERIRRDASDEPLPAAGTLEFVRAPFEVQLRVLALVGALHAMPRPWDYLPRPAFLVARETPTCTAYCGKPGCRTVVTVPYPRPDPTTIRCARCCVGIGASTVGGR